MTDGKSRLIVALDLPDRRAALSAVEQLAGRVGYFKIGLELFVSEGPELVREIRGRGERVFLDLKLHDIPNTVAAAVRAASRSADSAASASRCSVTAVASWSTH